MPYKDPERARIAALEANRRYRQRLHDARFGVGVGDMRGRLGGPARMGPAHPRWNGGVMRTSHGYIGLKVPKGHHLRQAHGYAYEHKLVAERMLGRRLMPGEVVHHKNRDRADNRPENLVVLMNGDHVRLHKTKHYSALLLGEQGRLLDELDRAPGDDQGGRELWQTGSRPRLLRSITDTPSERPAWD